MTKKCELTGVLPLKGHNVSHANNKTKRRFLPNLKKISFKSDILKRNIRLNVSNAALRTVDFKGGLDKFLKSAKNKKLSKRVQKLKRHEQQGLIGELAFLKVLIKSLGIKNAIDSWKGPDKLAKDFLLSSVGIEVKAKQGGLKGLVQISSEYQLDSEDLSKLFLVVLERGIVMPY